MSDRTAGDREAPHTAEQALDAAITRFGGTEALAHKLELPEATVLQWQRDGAIPADRLSQVQHLALAESIELPDEDMALLRDAAPAPADTAYRPDMQDEDDDRRATAMPDSFGSAAALALAAAQPAPAQRWAGLLALPLAALALAAILTAPWWLSKGSTASVDAALQQRLDALETRLADSATAAGAGAASTQALDTLRGEIGDLRTRVEAGATAAALTPEERARLGGAEGLAERLQGIDSRLAGVEDSQSRSATALDERLARMDTTQRAASGDSQAVAALQAEIEALARRSATAEAEAAAARQALASQQREMRSVHLLTFAAEKLRSRLEAGVPYDDLVPLMLTLGEQDAALQQRLGALHQRAVTGVASRGALLRDLQRLRPELLAATAPPAQKADDVVSGVMGQLSGLVKVRQIAPDPAAPAEPGSAAATAIAKAEGEAAAGRLAEAAATLRTLPAGAAERARAWMQAAEARAEADAALAQLDRVAMDRLKALASDRAAAAAPETPPASAPQQETAQ